MAPAEETWKDWLMEVEPVITTAEKTVFSGLKTEEEKARFIRSFWKVRDPDPQTAVNEYKREYYKRLNYVKSHVGGPRTDQGKIFMILAEPKERVSHTGGEKVVDSEIWTYYAEGRSGLPPVINILFYRRDNVGKFRMFYPGMNTALDILSPGYRFGWEDPRKP